MTQIDDKTVTASELAGWLGVQARTVRALAADGRVVGAGRGYALQASVLRYIDHLRGVASGRGGAQHVATLTEERARLSREQADAQAMKNAVLRGELVPVAGVEREWSDILRGVRSRMLAVPSRVRARLGHVTAADAAVMDGEIRKGLIELGEDRA